LNSATQRLLIPGPAGSLEVAIDQPADSAATGLAVVAHPHPLFGGTLDNKVAQTIARAFVAQGMICLRPNFRGVGKSEGVHDHGQGEVDDLLAAWQWLMKEFPSVEGRRWLGGFSFGGVMATHVAKTWPSGQPPLDRVILVGLGISPDRRAAAGLTPAARLIHGELDEVIGLKDLLDWARPQHFPVLVVPGAGHFFHGQLNELKACVQYSLAA
jgi:alpha/beta superfamily hydrolase